MELTEQLTSLAEWAATEVDANRLRSLAAKAAEVTPDECFYASLASTLDEMAGEQEPFGGWRPDIHKLADECRAESRRLIELAEAALEVAW